jgi:riboflavin-specific deaminase-like protein
MMLPFITVKYASTLDGRIATKSGDSKWISSEATLQLAHQLRGEHEAILVGIKTVLADDPQLTTRLVAGGDPLRVIVDSRLEIPMRARVLADGRADNTLIATSAVADKEKIALIKKRGAEVVIVPTENESWRLSLVALLEELAHRGVKSVLVEGGSQIITSLLAARLVNRLVVVIAPKIIGRGIAAIDDLGIARLSDAITFTSVEISNLGGDVVFDCRL